MRQQSNDNITLRHLGQHTVLDNNIERHRKVDITKCQPLNNHKIVKQLIDPKNKKRRQIQYGHS